METGFVVLCILFKLHVSDETYFNLRPLKISYYFAQVRNPMIHFSSTVVTTPIISVQAAVFWDCVLLPLN